jgi:hypothetical protein
MNSDMEMDKEAFIESVKSQFVDEIKEAFLECEHHGGQEIDHFQLNRRLKSLMSGAKKAGIPHKEFHQLVQIVLPHVVDKLAFNESGKRSA